MGPLEVPVRELKAKLSAYLARAAAGEHITVTDRGRPIATLGPIVAAVDLGAGIEEGWITPPTSRGLRPVRRRRARAGAAVLEVLGEDRME